MQCGYNNGVTMGKRIEETKGQNNSGVGVSAKAGGVTAGGVASCRTPMSALKRKRLSLGMTLRDLAGKIGCSHVSAHQWEKGKRVPTPNIIPKAAKALGISNKEFLELVEPASTR